MEVKRKFKIGEKVQNIYGSYTEAKVIDILPNNEYKLDYLIIQKDSRDKEQRGTTVLPWYRIIKLKNESDKILNKRKENWMTRISFHNTLLQELVRRVENNVVNMNPNYQRDLVWEHQDKELLIESIFEGIEIGKFTFIYLQSESENDYLYEVLDGKQRLTTLFEFMTDQFKYKGKYFSELNVEDRRYFLNYNVTSGETNFELTEKQKIEYFLKLNTTGKVQSQKHLDKLKKML